MSIYFDNASTTPVAPEVRQAMDAALTEGYHNPSAVYREGRAARAAAEAARAAVAEAIGAQPGTMTLTSGGTEANNLALKGVALAHGHGHIITSAAEHKSVLASCEWLSRLGFSLTVLPWTLNPA